MMTIKLVFKFIFYFLGTFLHELSHYIAALLFGKPTGFSLCPKIEKGSFIFGSVKYKVRFRILSSFISSAPLLWWLVLVLMLFYFQMIRWSGRIPTVNFSLILHRLKSLSLPDAVFIWVFIQLLWAGKLSTTDLKNFFSGIFSFSGLVFALAIALAVCLFQRFLLKI